MIGFVAEQALPVGTRIRVTLTSGLRDLDGDTLPHDLAWSFETAPLELSNLPVATASPGDPTPAPYKVHPTLAITANAPVDLDSRSHRMRRYAPRMARRLRLMRSPSRRHRGHLIRR